MTTGLAGLYPSSLHSKWEGFKMGGRSFALARLSQSFLWEAAKQPVVSNLGAYVAISSLPAKPWHVSAQLQSSSWMFYPWLALMLSSSYCFKAAWCNIKAAAQTKHIQAGSWGGKRENSQQSDHAGLFFLLLQWEWRACRRPAGRRCFIGVSLARGKTQLSSECR